MLVILSQHIDYDSSYADELFHSYHYPARYRNQLHKGDTFVYYQGNRYDKSQRYYFGSGTIGEIVTSDGENYYATLIDCQKFEKKVPIHLPDGGYIEQLRYETVRKRPTPPWQSSIRPLSQEAYDYILAASGIHTVPDPIYTDSVEHLREKLKTAVREYYVGDDPTAIRRIESIASAIGTATLSSHPMEAEAEKSINPHDPSVEECERLFEYCRKMRMSYSYKPLLILALIHAGNNGSILIENAANYFLEFYSERKRRGLKAEKKRCIYLDDDVTVNQIEQNLIANPVKALVASGFFTYDEKKHVFSISSSIWETIKHGQESAITTICENKLEAYYAD